MEIYDIIHGSIEIEPLAKKIIDTKEFQRLRNIKQLGCCNYVFPGTLHTRFEHSIGVYHLACMYIKILEENNTDKKYFNDEQIKCITTAALIHDLGHGPYSHLFDELIPKDKNHEYRSIEILKHMNQKYNLEITDDEISMIYMIIKPDYNEIKEKKYLYQIVTNANGIDVDRFDYIMRDIKMTGLNYGIEYERIMNHSYIKDNEIIYSEKVQMNIEDFYRIRFLMYKDIYNHHTVRAIEYMMKEYIRLLDIYIGISEIFEFNEWEKFIKLTDSIVNILPFMQKSDKLDEMKKVLKRIDERNIYKSVGEIVTGKEIKFNNKYDKKNCIIDIVKLSYYGKERCKYTSYEKLLELPEMSDKYITSVYYKNIKSKPEAEILYMDMQKERNRLYKIYKIS